MKVFIPLFLCKYNFYNETSSSSSFIRPQIKLCCGKRQKLRFFMHKMPLLTWYDLNVFIQLKKCWWVYIISISRTWKPYFLVRWEKLCEETKISSWRDELKAETSTLWIHVKCLNEMQPAWVCKETKKKKLFKNRIESLWPLSSQTTEAVWGESFSLRKMLISWREVVFEQKTQAPNCSTGFVAEPAPPIQMGEKVKDGSERKCKIKMFYSWADGF